MTVTHSLFNRVTGTLVLGKHTAYLIVPHKQHYTVHSTLTSHTDLSRLEPSRSHRAHPITPLPFASRTPHTARAVAHATPLAHYDSPTPASQTQRLPCTTSTVSTSPRPRQKVICPLSLLYTHRRLVPSVSIGPLNTQRECFRSTPSPTRLVTLTHSKTSKLKSMTHARSFLRYA